MHEIRENEVFSASTATSAPVGTEEAVLRKTLHRSASLVILANLLAGSVWAQAPEGLPVVPSYGGEIHRGADGKLMAFPEAEPASPEPSANAASAEKTIVGNGVAPGALGIGGALRADVQRPPTSASAAGSGDPAGTGC